jgi:hypothetical protein
MRPDPTKPLVGRPILMMLLALGGVAIASQRQLVLERLGFQAWVLAIVAIAVMLAALARPGAR